jgi:hypothetical protein
MSPFERLMLLADEEVLILARNMIGKKRLALLIAKAALEETDVELSPTDASKILEMPLSTVKNHMTNAFKKDVK